MDFFGFPSGVEGGGNDLQGVDNGHSRPEIWCVPVANGDSSLSFAREKPNLRDTTKQEEKIKKKGVNHQTWQKG